MNLTTELLKEGKYVFLAERLKDEKKKANHPPVGEYSFGKVTIKKPSKNSINPACSLPKKQLLLNKNPYCHYCNIGLDKTTATIDHLTPLSKGGKRMSYNEVLCCKPCNLDKGSLTEGEYIAVLAYRKSL